MNLVWLASALSSGRKQDSHAHFLLLSKNPKPFKRLICMQQPHPLSLRLSKCIRKPTHIVRKRATVRQKLHVRAVHLDPPLLPQLHILLAPQRRKSPILADNNLLAAGKLVLRTAKGLDGSRAVSVSRANGKQDLTDVDAGHGACWLAVGTTHPRLQSVGAGAGQHFVDADDVVRVGTYAEVKAFFAGDLDEVLVGADAGRFERFGGELFVLVCEFVLACGCEGKKVWDALETRWTQVGNSSTPAFFLPRSKMRILGSGTPRLKRDLGYGLFLQ